MDVGKMTKIGASLSQCALLLLFPILAYANELHNEPKLHHLSVVFRHGDRMPETFPRRFPNDPNMHESFWPVGAGELTNEGKRRAHRLGEMLRNRYAGFLAGACEPGKLHAVSSSLPRTRNSLQLVVAALCPPSLSPRGKWHETLDWQPIPTYYRRFKEDTTFGRDRCEIFMEEYNKVLNSSEVQNRLREYDTYLENLRLAVGKKSPLTLNDILLLHNNLDIEARINLKIEPWMKEAFSNQNLTKMRSMFYEFTGYNDVLRRYQSGGILRNITDDMLNTRNNTSNYEKKVSLYSGHDKNIIGLLQSLNIYDSHFPEFGSALIFELLSQEEQYYVKILYYLGIPEEMKTFTLPNCTTLCPLDKFVNLTEKYRATDQELNCKIKGGSYFSDDN